MKIKSIDPSNYDVIGEVECSTAKDIEDKIISARKALPGWIDLQIEGRKKVIERFISAIANHKDELAKLQSIEMGMTIQESDPDVVGGIDLFNWYKDNAAKCLAPEVTFENDKEIHTVYREPRGVVASIIPWNYPLANFIWQCGQSLLAGNVVILKHSEEVMLFEKKIEEIAKEAGMPEGVLSYVYGDGKVGDMLAHADIDMLCFTGSTKTGKYLYKVAAEKFIPVVMEMGGSAPGIVFEDADIDETIGTIYAARFMGCGQMCDGLKRLIVHKSKFEEVSQKLKSIIESKKIGPATDPSSDVGPLVSERQLVALESQVQDAIAKGAKVVTGGKKLDEQKGAYYMPSLLTDITADMKVWQEEVFGPVLTISTFETEQEAIDMANDTIYGLGGYVFTKDKEKAKRVAAQLQTGMVSQNNLSYIKPYNPFGGYKSSGIGREHGKYGFEDVTQVKVVVTEK